MIAWDSADIGGDTGSWIDDDQIRISEYFKRVETKRKLFKFSVPNPETGEADIQTATEDQMGILAAAFFESQGAEVPTSNEAGLMEAFIQASGIQILAEREGQQFKVMRYIINGVEVLEEETWPGMVYSYLPPCGAMSIIKTGKDTLSL